MPTGTPSSPHPAAPPASGRAAWKRHWPWALAAAAALAAAFALYAEPGFVVMLADQVWACF